jgi:predicted nucleic acid-binding protein
VSTAFWDTSGLVLLALTQRGTKDARRLARAHPPRIVWWGTRVEAEGALQRRLRLGQLDPDVVSFARRAVTAQLELAFEVPPSDRVRELALRLLGRQPLRSADALQLAAALVACRETPRERVFVSFDETLAACARAEGFVVPT